MKYMCLVYGEESAIGRLDDVHCLDFDRSIRDSGHNRVPAPPHRINSRMSPMTPVWQPARPAS